MNDKKTALEDYGTFVIRLLDCGWRSTCDAQHENIRKFWEEHILASMQKPEIGKLAEDVEFPVFHIPEGYQLVPIEPTREMLNAAVDVDSFKLGDISPIGFRCSPQQLFERCYKAMLAAAPTSNSEYHKSEYERGAKDMRDDCLLEVSQGYDHRNIMNRISALPLTKQEKV
jgi:hypothetical protein